MSFFHFFTPSGSTFSIDSLYDNGNNPGGYMDLTTLAGTVYEDSAGTDVAEINDGVALIQDGGPSGYDFTQPTVAERPTLKNDGTHNYLEFDGTSDHIVLVKNEPNLLRSKRILAGYAIDINDNMFPLFSQPDTNVSWFGYNRENFPSASGFYATTEALWVDGVSQTVPINQGELHALINGAKHTVIFDVITNSAFIATGAAEEFVLGKYANVVFLDGNVYAMAWVARGTSEAPSADEISGLHNWLDERLN